jgi:hypothetical protein
MANEGYFSIRLDARKGGSDVTTLSSSRFTIAGDNFVKSTQLIGTTAETVDFGEISGAPQMCNVSNLDATNFVELGGDAGMTGLKLKLMPGMSNLVSLSSATLYAKSDTAPARIEVTAIES